MVLGRELSKHLITEGVTNVSRRHDWLRIKHEQPDAMGSSDLGGTPEGTLLWLIGVNLSCILDCCRSYQCNRLVENDAACPNISSTLT